MEIQPLDTAAEPVDLQDDAEFMDTGVLHELPKKGKKSDDESDAVTDEN